MRLLDLIDSTSGYFAKNNIASPRLNAELLVAEILGKTRLQLYLHFESDVPEEKLALLRPMVKKRAEGYPVEYILGYKEFAGRRFRITPDVLVPRPETEFLLETILPLIDPAGLPVVDVGVGSGIIAVTLAVKFPGLTVHGIDVSPAALAVAKENGKNLTNIAWAQSDLLSNFSLLRAQMIVANLPYIPTAQIPTLTREVRAEPALALDGGPAGLDLISRLVTQAAGKTAYLALEIGDDQVNPVKELLEKNRFKVVKITEDLRKVPRIVVGQESS